ncbi:MAG TPA: PIN domain-containing protein [Candidatus Norongarragalinales archaeon]|nr:PIN domain-containing protein [Candidatus Norongarragalinales archaeon]
MELVVDTNIVAAAILKKGLTRNLLFNGELSLYAPDRLATELLKHEKEFTAKSGLSREQFQQAAAIVLSRVVSLPFESYASYSARAKQISPDADDWPFFAAALQRNCPIWSNDKKLKLQTAVKLYSTEELLARLA